VALNRHGIATGPEWSLVPPRSAFIADDVFIMRDRILAATEAILHALLLREVGMDLEVRVIDAWRDPHAPQGIEGTEELPFGEPI